MKTYLITGGAGFIGSNFITYLLKKYDDIFLINIDALTYAGNLENLTAVEQDPRYLFVKGDICDAQKIDDLFFKYPIDYVVNFAAESHVDRSISEPEIFIKTNVLGTANLLTIAKKHWSNKDGTYRAGVKFHQVSTDEVYGALGKTGFFTENTPLNPHSPYSASKASADLLVKAYYDTYKMPVTITRCSNNYGPNQFPEKLIPLMFLNAINGKALPVYGDGLQVRDWLYVEDHCKAIDLVLKSGQAGNVYNVGGHNEYTNLAIIHIILSFLREHAGYSVLEDMIKHIADRKGHDRRYAINAEKIENELGWAVETPFEEGIQKTLKWYLSHAEWLRHAANGEYQKYYESIYGENC